MSSANRLQFALNGMERITSEDGVVEMDIYAIKAVSADVTFGAGCVARTRAAPAEGDPLLQGDVLLVRLTSVELATGIAYICPEDPEEE